jgi:hypothetical protein
MHTRAQPSMDVAQFEDVPQQPIIMRLADVLADEDDVVPRPSCFRFTNNSSPHCFSSRRRSRRESPVPTIETGHPSSDGGSRMELATTEFKPSISFSALRVGMRSRARSFVTSALTRSREKLQGHIVSSSESLISRYSLVDEDGILLLVKST